MIRQYAASTSVPVAKTRIEMEGLLQRYGASSFAYATQDGIATVMFQIELRQVKLVLRLPGLGEDRFWKTPGRHARRSDSDALKLWEQACRASWRALLLVVKAKLEVTSVRIERLQSISDADIAAEGVTRVAVEALIKDLPAKTVAELFDDADLSPQNGQALREQVEGNRVAVCNGDGWVLGLCEPIDLWRIGWTAINGAESWAANPWVWVIEFRRVL